MGISLLASWPEPVQRVQLLAESGLKQVPSQYIRPHVERPHLHIAPAAAASTVVPTASAESCNEQAEAAHHGSSDNFENIPILDMEDLESGDGEKRGTFLRELRRACEEWGFLQVKNHGVEEVVMEGVRSATGAFFKLPIGEKQLYANDPVTYQGYGSRLGINKDAILDWSDYFFLNVLPSSSRDETKWPTNPPLWRFQDSVAIRKETQDASPPSSSIPPSPMVHSLLVPSFHSPDLFTAGSPSSLYPSQTRLPAQTPPWLQHKELCSTAWTPAWLYDTRISAPAAFAPHRPRHNQSRAAQGAEIVGAQGCKSPTGTKHAKPTKLELGDAQAC